VYDKNYVHVFPEVDSFLAGKAQSQFRNLSVQVHPPLPSFLLFSPSHRRCLLLCLQHSRGARPRLLMQDAHGSALSFATFECFLTRAAGASVDILVDAWKQADIGAHHSCKLLLNCGILTSCPSLPISPHLAVDYLSQRLSQ
jgi:hypothetical protein